MVDVKISGMDEILKKLKTLPEKVQKNVVNGAIRASAKPIIKEARAKVPVDSGTLKKSIGVVKRRSKNKNIVLFTVAPRKKKGGYYAHFVEFGTYSKLDHQIIKPRGGKLGKKRAESVNKGYGVAPKPFMRPAFEQKGDETINNAREYMRKRIDKEIAKL